MGRVSTGIKRMDKLIEGGFPSSTVILVSGGPGGGKTLFSLNYLLEGARKKEKCCYISLNESKEEILRAAKGIESMKDISKHIDKTLLVEDISLGENISMKKFVHIISKYPKIDRLVIDDVNKLLVFSQSDKDYRVKLSDLVRSLKTMGCTLLLCETRDGEIDTGNGEAFEADGVLHFTFLDVEEKPKRIIEIHKMRYTSFDPKVGHNLRITPKGIDLGNSKVI